MGEHFGFGDRGGENLRRLEVYDRLGAQQQRTSMAEQKAQFEQAFKESEQQRKISATEERLKIAQEHNDLIKQQRDLQDTVAQARLETLKAQIALQQHKAESTTEVAKQTTGLFNDLESARDSKGFVSPSTLAKLRAQYPDAAMHPNNSAALEHELRRYDDAQKLAIQSDAAAAKVAADAAAAAAKKAGATTVITKGPNGESVRVVIPNTSSGVQSPEAQAQLLQQHDILAKGLQGLSGDDLTKQVAVLNAVKKQIPGYDLLDAHANVIPGSATPIPTQGQVAPSAAPVPTGAPAIGTDYLAGGTTGAASALDASGPSNSEVQSTGAALDNLGAPAAVPTPAPAALAYDALHSTADDAIKAGANPDAVKARLKQMGGDPARLTYDD